MDIIVVPDHPELDQPDGDIQWQDYLDVICKLDLHLRFMEKKEKVEPDVPTPPEAEG